jgi:hypothetical protein
LKKDSIPILNQSVDIDESDYDKIEKNGRCPFGQKYQPEKAEDLEDWKGDDTFDANDREKKSSYT